MKKLHKVASSCIKLTGLPLILLINSVSAALCSFVRLEPAASSLLSRKAEKDMVLGGEPDERVLAGSS